DRAALPIDSASLPAGIGKRSESLGAIQTTLLASSSPDAQSRLQRFVATLPMPAGRRILVGPDGAEARTYVVEVEGAVERRHVEDAGVMHDPMDGRPAVWVRYNAQGAAAIERLSGAH